MTEKTGSLVSPLMAEAAKRTLRLLAAAGCLVMLTTVAYLALAARERFLFEGLDGSYMLELRSQQAKWMPRLTGFTSNPLQSLGNVWFPVNMNLIPGYVIPTMSGGFNSALAYLIFSFELFLATLLVGVLLGIGVLRSAITAAVLVILAMPLLGPPLLFGFFTLVPHHATMVLTTYLMLLIFSGLGRWGTAHSLAAIALLILCFLHVVLSQPLGLVLGGPVLAVFFLASLSAGVGRREMVWKVMGIVGLGVTALLGPLTFLRGLVSHTAVAEFQRELIQSPVTWKLVSVSFDGGLWGKLLVVLALFGAFHEGVKGRPGARPYAAAFLVAVASLFIAGVFLVVRKTWRGPYPHYFESYLWPCYAVYAAKGAEKAWLAGRELLCRPSNRGWWTRAYLGLLLAGLAGVVFVEYLVVLKSIGGPYPFPPSMTPIVDYLQRAVALSPGSPFRGRVATLTGSAYRHPTAWLPLRSLDDFVIDRFGNDHRMVGLWHYDIPTLVEYSPLIAPELFVYSREFFIRPGDRQTRNVIMLRRANEKLFRALGVRFLVSDSGAEPGTKRLNSFGNRVDLHLHEISDVNVGNYSPLRVETASSAKAIVAALKRGDFDPRTTILLERSFEEPLVAATGARLVARVGGWEINAESTGSSLLLLPISYSHCLEMAATSGNPELLRANLLQAALWFRGRLSVKLDYFTGPFARSDCRLKDAADMKRLEVTSR